MRIRHLTLLVFLTLANHVCSQNPVPLSFDPDVMTSELMDRFTRDITGRIDEQLKTAEGYVLDESLIREMLVPYQEYGINPDDGEYYKAIHGIYTSIRTDPNYDPGAEFQTRINDLIQTRINTYARSFIDEESQEIYGQLKGLFDDANGKIVGLMELAERMYELPPDDPEIETKWAAELRKLGITGGITDLIEDFETVFGQAQAQYGKPIEMITMIKDGLSTEDPTQKIEILFDFGEKFGEDLPLVGSLVSNLFKLGKEVLSAAKRAGGILEENLGQGCISSDGEYVQGAKKKQKFYQHFPHIDRACPLSLSASAGVYQHIYYNMSNASELLFYHDEDWLGSEEESQDGTHAGEADLKAIRVFLNSKGENTKASDLAFLHGAYTKSPGFIHFRKEINEKLNEIRTRATQTYASLSHCEERAVESFMMERIGMDWLTRLMKGGSQFDFSTVRIFTQQAADDIADQMLTNRYIRLNQPNLERLDDIIDNLKDNVPIVIYGKVSGKETRMPVGEARISADIPFLIENTGCVRNVTSSDGTFTLLLNLPLAFEGKLGFTAAFKSLRETEELNVNIEQSRMYEVNFFLEIESEVLSEITISPKNGKLMIGETLDFTVMAKYADGKEQDVTPLALREGFFKAESVGQFYITASYLGKEAIAVITVEVPGEEAGPEPEETDPGSCDEATQRWNAESGKCECLSPLLENSEGKCVSADELERELEDGEECEELSKELILLIEAARQLNDAYLDNHRVFQMQYTRFFKEVNDQASEVCDNRMISYTFYMARISADRMKILEEELVSLLIDVTYISTVCPALNELLSQNGFGNDVTQWVEFFDVTGALASMSDRLTESGCNTDDVAQNGEGIAPGELDPTFVSKGGTSTEIPGDGRDNDGDGLQDEIPVAGLPGYNITIALYDSGNAKDDVFELSVDGLGSLGLTPAGGLRTYGLNLPPGTYSAEVLVVVAPDDVGTFTINILQHGHSIGSLSGEPGEGSVSTIVFDVTE